MAEIHIERKERSAWPWLLLGLIVLALLLWWLLAAGDDGDLVVQDTAAPIVDTAAGTVGRIASPAGAPAAVVAFIEYANESRTRQVMDTTHEYTADGIRRLARALGALADQRQGQSENLRQHVDSMATLADQLEQNWQSASHADYARRAFLQATMVMDRLAESGRTAAQSQVSQARQTAQGIDGNRQLLQQRQQVQRFFDQAADALRVMSG